jgi:hypothetical protein
VSNCPGPTPRSRWSDHIRSAGFQIQARKSPLSFLPDSVSASIRARAFSDWTRKVTAPRQSTATRAAMGIRYWGRRRSQSEKVATAVPAPNQPPRDMVTAMPPSIISAA